MTMQAYIDGNGIVQSVSHDGTGHVATPGLTEIDTDAVVWPGMIYANGAFSEPPLPTPVLADVQTKLCADIDRQAEQQRALYITTGSGMAMVYGEKQTEATDALANASAATAAAYPLLAVEVGITVDPQSNAPATDVLGVARAVMATVALWKGIAAAIETVRLGTKKTINAAANVTAAQAAHDGVVWPQAGN